MLIAMLNRLRQRDRRRDYPCRASALACQLPLAIGSDEDALVAVPAIAEPVQFALMGPLDGVTTQVSSRLAKGEEIN